MESAVRDQSSLIAFRQVSTLQVFLHAPQTRSRPARGHRATGVDD